MGGDLTTNRPLVRVRILGVDSSEAEPPRSELVGEMTGYFAAEGLDADVFFREPGGMGLPPLESIELYLGGVATGVVTNLLASAVESTTRAIVSWARERIRRQPPEPELEEERSVVVALFGPRGELLKQISVTRDGVDEPFVHPILLYPTHVETEVTE